MTLKGIQSFGKKSKSFDEMIAYHLHNTIESDLKFLLKDPVFDSPSSCFSVNNSSCSILDMSLFPSSSPLTLPGVDYKVCRVKFKHVYRTYRLSNVVSEAKVGDFLVVQSYVDKHSEDLGVITDIYTFEQYDEMTKVLGPSEDPDENKVGKILRMATMVEKEYLSQKQQRENFLLSACKQYVENRSILMTIHGVEYQFDGNVLFIYYMSRDRVDFRPLVKFLLKLYCKATRIQLKRIDQCREYISVPHSSQQSW